MLEGLLCCWGADMARQTASHKTLDALDQAEDINVDLELSKVEKDRSAPPTKEPDAGVEYQLPEVKAAELAFAPFDDLPKVALGKRGSGDLKTLSKTGVAFGSTFATPRTQDDDKGSSGFMTSRSIATTAWSGGTDGKEFTVTIERAAGASLGLNLDALDGISLVVSSVKAGPVRAYNESVDEDEQLQPGDSILEVNGVRDSSQALLDRLKLDSALTLSVKRPRVLSISITRAYGPLGLQVEHAPNGTTLLVMKVNPGLIKDWNLSHRGLGIKRRDRVSCVNGLRGNPTELMARMKQAAVQNEKLELEVCRY
mmetsp:Transcript_96862/g.172385  ORF Transcript_96862/g.172385 Transcript_96862/m.172385 type:complete len:312 (-) Transcript_96862:152-1087(-)|eukprot:CAMPEP_0197624486 /NCGR_PEP_ID=MMETSP1338-20131121/4101_1 /TAXON_ID=43686 ORGANISM="Pelagodinium beii, Strain RCC1491" /NCGR_SAMPLE_ID=MMETSP1338 /ASSEMBLY_ACC=CAM_ASM_000754 /LENGTH=311 /DNA_ID=CAMNT_0043194625 /DNA_START=60 /DNA_END=995 /DNA_ORIENTATION=+